MATYSAGVKLVLLLVMLLGPVALLEPAEARTPAPTGGSTFERSVLTRDDTSLALAGGRKRLVMTATGNGPDWNRREVFTAPGARPKHKQTTCATWTAQSGTMLQQGLAVRIRHERKRVRAITLTKNTIFDVNWIFNVLTWDTDRDGDIWRTVGQFNMASALVDPDGKLRPLPWRVCLRTVGRTVAFKVWLPREMRRPSWTDETYARSATVPRGFRAAGRPGWYVGHVPDGGRLVYRNLRTS